MTSSDNCYTGACTENGVISDVLGTSSYLTTNVRVFKTGARTGSTAGKITETCVDIVAGGDKILCSSTVEYDASIATSLPIADGGDSGSAVLTNGGTPGSNSGTLAGILWGGINGNQYLFYFSPWENIWQQERAGTSYGLPVTAITASQGARQNSGGGSGGCDEPLGDPGTMRSRNPATRRSTHQRRAGHQSDPPLRCSSHSSLSTAPCSAFFYC